MEKILVSACLVGNNCKYNGKNNKNEKIIEFLKDKEVILVCPEVNEEGKDVTNNFTVGAQIALKRAIANNVKLAILKEKSPSCGVKQIYNGEFNGTKVDGSGVFARLLKENGIEVLTEEDFAS